MRMIDFQRIKCLKDEDNFNKELKVDDIFLYGNKMIHQRETKKEGDQISYYKVIKNEDNKVEYVINFDILDKEE